jgi:RHS repeat-associated protein
LRQTSSKERDSETGLDYFGARYFSSAQGRFTSPDAVGNFVADLRFPQTWNLYNYVGNNPLSRIDPDGRSCVDTSNGKGDDGDGKGCKDAGVAPTKDQKPPKDTSDITPQQVNVSGQQGSLLAFLTAPPVPRYVPNDTPLDQKGQIVTHELSKRIDQYPTVCGGGVYAYLGKEFDIGAANAFAGTIVEYDSREGLSKGALFEAGGGEGIVGGAGYAATTSGGQLAGTGLGYAGVGVHSPIGAASAGVVGFGSGGNVSGAGVYGEGFLFGRGGGVGAYLNITNVGKCRQ